METEEVGTVLYMFLVFSRNANWYSELKQTEGII